MENALRKLSLAVLSALTLIAVSACRESGPAQKAGTAIDQAAQKVKDAIDPPGPVEKVGRAVDRALK